MNPVLLSSLSLAVLIGVIALGFLKKWNVGILSFGAAMLMGMAAGMTQKQIVAGFNTSLFVILLGSMFLFSIAQLNGTMDLLAKKTVALAGGRGWAVPIFMYLLGAVVAALGPGTIPGFGIAAMFGVPLALEMKTDPFLFCTIGQMGAIAGGIVPWAPTGVAGISKAAEAGYTEHVALPLFLNTLFGTIFVYILLFVLYRGWRIKGSAGGQRWRDIPRFDRNQRLTLVAILVMVVCVIVLKTDIGLTCFLLACILIALKVSEFSACVQAIPWNTILLVVGTDSHTCTYGALGAFATGIGSTEMLGVLATGEIWLKVPQTIRLRFDGALQEGVMAKDVVLRAIGTVGHNGATYKAMEFCGTTFDAMSMDERLCVANMAVEAGAKNGLIPYDGITADYLRELGVEGGWPCESNPDAVFCQDLSFDAAALEPLCACPHEVDNVAPVREVAGVAIHQAYLGSCTGGRYNDLARAAQLLRGKKIAKGIRLLVSPASREIWERCARDGILTALSEAGATVLASSCGACLGVHSGAIGAGEVCVSATNRNFIGRMGSKQGQVYLGSPLTVAASALTGRLTDPRDVS